MEVDITASQPGSNVVAGFNWNEKKVIDVLTSEMLAIMLATRRGDLEKMVVEFLGMRSIQNEVEGQTRSWISTMVLFLSADSCEQQRGAHLGPCIWQRSDPVNNGVGQCVDTGND